MKKTKKFKRVKTPIEYKKLRKEASKFFDREMSFFVDWKLRAFYD